MLVFRQTQNNTQRHLNTPNSIQLMLKSSTHVLNCEVTACRARICRVRDKQINKRESVKKHDTNRESVFFIQWYCVCVMHIKAIEHNLPFLLKCVLRRCFIVYIYVYIFQQNDKTKRETQRNATQSIIM